MTCKDSLPNMETLIDARRCLVLAPRVSEFSHLYLPVGGMIDPLPLVKECSMTTPTSSGCTPTNPDTEQIGGRHYKKLAIQPWDYVIANELDYFQGSIIKYVTRWRDKGWTEDLHKAKHFLDKYILTMEEKYPHLKERPDNGTPNPHS